MKTAIFKSENGFSYDFPENHCIFCKHCTGIIYDYTNGPYMFFCELEKESYATCNSFSYDGFSRIIIDKEDKNGWY